MSDRRESDAGLTRLPPRCKSTVVTPELSFGGGGLRRCVLSAAHEGEHFDNVYVWDDEGKYRTAT